MQGRRRGQQVRDLFTRKFSLNLLRPAFARRDYVRLRFDLSAQGLLGASVSTALTRHNQPPQRFAVVAFRATTARVRGTDVEEGFSFSACCRRAKIAERPSRV